MMHIVVSLVFFAVFSFATTNFGNVGMAVVAHDELPDIVQSQLWRVKVQQVPDIYSYVWLPRPGSPKLLDIIPVDKLKALLKYRCTNPNDPPFNFSHMFWPAIMVQYVIPSGKEPNDAYEIAQLREIVPLILEAPTPEFVRVYRQMLYDIRRTLGKKVISFPIQLPYLSPSFHPSRIYKNIDRYMNIVTSCGLDSKEYIRKLNKLISTDAIMQKWLLHQTKLNYLDFPVSPNNIMTFLTACAVELNEITKVNIFSDRFVVFPLRPNEKVERLNRALPTVTKRMIQLPRQLPLNHPRIVTRTADHEDSADDYDEEAGDDNPIPVAAKPPQHRIFHQGPLDEIVYAEDNEEYPVEEFDDSASKLTTEVPPSLMVRLALPQKRAREEKEEVHGSQNKILRSSKQPQASRGKESRHRPIKSNSIDEEKSEDDSDEDKELVPGVGGKFPRRWIRDYLRQVQETKEMERKRDWQSDEEMGDYRTKQQSSGSPTSISDNEFSDLDDEVRPGI